MKAIILLTFILIGTLQPAWPQRGDDCYSQFLKEGKAAFDNLDFPTAISNFEAAAICEDRPSNPVEINNWLKKAKDRFINELQEQKDTIEAQKSSLEKALLETDRQRQRADSARVIAEGARLALLATNETENGNDTSAMILALKANLILKDADTPSIKYAFGQAAYNYFSKNYSSTNQRLLNLFAIPETSDFLIALNDGQVGRISPDNPQIKIFGKYDGFITSADFNITDGKSLTTTGNKEARIWKLSDNESTNLKGHSQDLTFGTYSEDAKVILTGSRDQTARLWNEEGQTLAVLQGHKGTVYEGHFSKSGLMITRASDGKVMVWKADGTLKTTISGHSNYVYSSVFSPDGQQILTASADGTAKLWTLEGDLVTTFTPDNSAVKAAIFSPNGQLVVTRTLGKAIKIYALDGTLYSTLKGHTGIITQAKFNHDGSQILTCSNDSTARIWQLDGQLKNTLQHDADLIEASFSTDGNLILSTSADGVSKLWDQNGDLLQTISTTVKPVIPAVFSADNQYIAFINESKTAKVWPIPEKAFTQLLGEEKLPISKIKSLEKKYDLNLQPLQ